jgi:DNA-binding winged helix-turn-helix (wHTH) protein
MRGPEQFPRNIALAQFDARSGPGARGAFAQDSIAFRDFKVRPGSRTLLRSGEVVCIGSRAFDLLVVLLEERGSVVSKRELLDRVWPSTIVDESNLRFQIATLRNVLGPDRDLIKSVPGRGYFFAYDRPNDASSANVLDGAVDRREPAAISGASQRLGDGLRGRLRGVAIEAGEHNDEIVGLLVHLARQLAEVHGSPETPKEAFSAMNG